jgi:hypothetical protein
MMLYHHVSNWNEFLCNGIIGQNSGIVMSKYGFEVIDWDSKTVLENAFVETRFKKWNMKSLQGRTPRWYMLQYHNRDAFKMCAID